MILVDTNVLVYAIGSDHPLRDAARRVVSAIRDRVVTGATIDAVYAELLWVLTRRRTRDAAAAAVRQYLHIFGAPLALTRADCRTAVDLFARNDRLQAVDALLAAVALREDVGAIVTADRAFTGVPGLRVLDPRSPELAAMLG